MRFLFIVLISLTFGFQLHAHNYYFGFAEMQYNATNQTLEATLVLSAHDLEDVLKSKKIIARELEFLEKDSLTIANLEIFVNSEFIVSTGSTRARFSLLGFEVLKNGFTDVELNSLKADYVEKMDLNGLKLAEAELCVKKVKELNSIKKSLEVKSSDSKDLYMSIHNTEKSEEDNSDLY